jgi:hypothetical protein
MYRGLARSSLRREAMNGERTTDPYERLWGGHLRGETTHERYSELLKKQQELDERTEFFTQLLEGSGYDGKGSAAVH